MGASPKSRSGTTVTLNEQLAVNPEAVAEQVTGVVPYPKAVPDGGTQLTTIVGQGSLAVGEKLTRALS